MECRFWKSGITTVISLYLGDVSISYLLIIQHQRYSFVYLTKRIFFSKFLILIFFLKLNEHNTKRITINICQLKNRNISKKKKLQTHIREFVLIRRLVNINTRSQRLKQFGKRKILQNYSRTFILIRTIGHDLQFFIYDNVFHTVAYSYLNDGDHFVRLKCNPQSHNIINYMILRCRQPVYQKKMQTTYF